MEKEKKAINVLIVFFISHKSGEFNQLSNTLTIFLLVMCSMVFFTYEGKVVLRWCYLPGN